MHRYGEVGCVRTGGARLGSLSIRKGKCGRRGRHSGARRCLQGGRKLYLCSDGRVSGRSRRNSRAADTDAGGHGVHGCGFAQRGPCRRHLCETDGRGVAGELRGRRGGGEGGGKGGRGPLCGPLPRSSRTHEMPVVRLILSRWRAHTCPQVFGGRARGRDKFARRVSTSRRLPIPAPPPPQGPTGVPRGSFLPFTGFCTSFCNTLGLQNGTLGKSRPCGLRAAFAGRWGDGPIGHAPWLFHWTR